MNDDSPDCLVLKLAAWLDAKGCRLIRHHSCQHVTIQEHRRNGWTTLAYGKTVGEACEYMQERGEFANSTTGANQKADPR